MVTGTLWTSVVAKMNFTWRRRLLERLEERVPGRGREHVDLVDDVNLEPVARRAEREPLLEAAHLVDAVVARAVNLLDVDVGPGGNLAARGADLARRGGRTGSAAVRAEAVQALASRRALRGLADAADAGEEERVRDAAAVMALASVRVTWSCPARSSKV